MTIDWHWSRHFDGPGELEYRCPCPKEPCGMVARNRTAPECSQHPFERAKTTRSGHRPEDCPGPPDDVITGYPDHYIVNGDTSSCPCLIHDSFFAGFTEDDWAEESGALVRGEHGGLVPLEGIRVEAGPHVVREDEPEPEPFAVGGLVLGEGVAISIDFEPMRRGLQEMAEGARRMAEVLHELRTDHPHLFEDINEDDYPISGDAMRVSWNDGMEDRPL